MLTFYINRAGSQLSASQRQILERAKIEPITGVERDGKPIFAVQGRITSAREASILDVVDDERARVKALDRLLGLLENLQLLGLSTGE